MKKTFLSVILFLFAMTNLQANPFFKAYKTPHETVPFDKIKNEHYEPAFEKGIQEHKAEIDAIVKVRSVPTFENTIVPYEKSGKLLSRVANVFFPLMSSESDDEMMEIAQRIQPKISAHSNEISLNELLFQKVKAVYDTRHSSNLNTEQIRLVEDIYRGFENKGANLSAEDKEKYKELSTKLSQLTLTFGQNTLKYSNAYEMHLTNEADLAGLPQMDIDAAAAKAKAKNKEGWIIDMSAPSYRAFMKYSSRRDLREKLYKDYGAKNFTGGEFDNANIVKEIAITRMQIAKLLGYEDYASYRLVDKMAKNKENVYKLLDELLAAYAVAAHSDVKLVEGYAVGHENAAIELMPWDWSYYSEKLRDAKYSVNDEMVRPYFELENVKKGVFSLATDLFGITFKKNTKIPVYHPDVEAFEVLDENGQYLAVLYTDFHPRKGKRQGAWMTGFKDQYMDKGTDSRPHISIVMNFTPPTENEPALLTFDEVNTFLHEFGHALHGILTKTTYASQSGTSVLHDFVELPSQIMENWLTEKEYLDRFARHYQTGEKIPAELVQKLIDAANYNAGYLCYRQLSFGYLDLAWHSIKDDNIKDVQAFEQAAMKSTNTLPVIDGMCMSTSFSHIFSGGYAAGYYGYKWAEVLDADAFAKFKETGIFNKETAKSFRENILEKGDTEDPMVLYKRFRGQEPSIDALLKREGIKK